MKKCVPLSAQVPYITLLSRRWKLCGGPQDALFSQWRDDGVIGGHKIATGGSAKGRCVPPIENRDLYEPD